MQAKYMISVGVAVVAASMAVADWARSDMDVASCRNEVQISFREGELVTISDEANDDVLAPACAELAEHWALRLGIDCNVVAYAPFVIAGDLPAQELRHQYHETIHPAAQAIQATYCKSKPDAPIVVLLFENEVSYRRHSERLFAQKQVSIYGYYKPSTRTLTINLATGAGTLVHELTHALVDFDFPRIPLWLNEGLGSLHEQSRFVTNNDDESLRIEGLVNWRLPILLTAIDEGQLESIHELVQSGRFRGTDESLNYAYARSLCMFLQYQGKLTQLYATLRGRIEQDTSGAATLQELFPDQSWQDIDRQFRDWVSQLVVRDTK